jgi:hypothetical protein
VTFPPANLNTSKEKEERKQKVKRCKNSTENKKTKLHLMPGLSDVQQTYCSSPGHYALPRILVDITLAATSPRFIAIQAVNVRLH